jgi:signal transduction histidine kinase/CheY-like chemotaxis protein
VRFLLLVMVIAAPVIVMLLIIHAELDIARAAARRLDATQHAEQVEADLANLLDGGRQLAAAIAKMGSAADQLPTCGTFLQAMRAAQPLYDSISIFAEDGETLCSTLAQPNDVLRLRNATLLGTSLQTRFLAVGNFVPANPGRGAVLPIAVPFLARDGGRHGVIMLTVNLERLHQRLGPRDIAPGASIGISDSDGTTLVRLPRDAGTSFIGKAMPPGIMPYVRASRRGIVDQIGYDGQPRLIAYIPATETSGNLPNETGLFVTYAVLRTGADGGSVWRDRRIAAAAGLSLLLGLLAGHIMFVRPMRGLLRAAGSMSKGDFAVRAVVPAIPAFAMLAEALNGMAEALGRDRRSLRELNLTLDARVHERTQDVVESRNRLEQEIAERTQIEAELRRAQKLQVVGQLAGGIAHHFNNLLTAVIGSLELMRRRISDPGDPHMISLIDGALQAADRGRRLTGQLLIFSRAQRMLPRSVDLNATVTQLSDLLVGTLGRGIRIDLVLAAPDSPGMGPVMVDPGQLEVALVNLAINARDAMERDGDARGVLTITTFATTLPDNPAAGDYVAIEMRDTGAGIAADLLARVFEPFFSTKPAERGTGLGLSQVQSLAVQSGGDVRIESYPGQGTTVLLLLPRAPLLRPPADAPTPTALGAAPSGKLRVLLVDDDRLVGDVIAEILTERGHDVVAASNAAEAIAALTQDHQADGPGFDLLLTDFVMPGMTGLGLIAAARDIRPGQHALLMTGHASFQPDDTIIAEEVIRKPFTMKELLLRIEQCGAG